MPYKYVSVKRFNVTGICRPVKHYMADVSGKLAAILNMVNAGAYFIVNSPHQYGKTSLVYSLSDQLHVSDKYCVLHLHFHGFDEACFETESAFVNAFIQKTVDQLGYAKPTASNHDSEYLGMLGLSRFISQVAVQSEKELVLIIDEIDHRANSRCFKNFLSVLRAKFLDRNPSKTFYSVVLEQSVKTPNNYAIIGRDADSPWNIATEFKVNLNLDTSELIPMLEEYKQDRGVKMDTHAIAEQLFYHASGHPFLTSMLCKILDEDLKKHEVWEIADVEKAVNFLIKNKQADFEDLFTCLESDPELYKLAKAIVIQDGFFLFNQYDPSIRLGILFGIFAEQSKLKIHNRIYHQVLHTFLAE
jgi:hypothetical protein